MITVKTGFTDRQYLEVEKLLTRVYNILYMGRDIRQRFCGSRSISITMTEFCPC